MACPPHKRELGLQIGGLSLLHGIPGFILYMTKFGFEIGRLSPLLRGFSVSILYTKSLPFRLEASHFLYNLSLLLLYTVERKSSSLEASLLLYVIFVVVLYTEQASGLEALPFWIAILL